MKKFILFLLLAFLVTCEEAQKSAGEVAGEKTEEAKESILEKLHNEDREVESDEEMMLLLDELIDGFKEIANEASFKDALDEVEEAAKGVVDSLKDGGNANKEMLEDL